MRILVEVWERLICSSCKDRQICVLFSCVTTFCAPWTEFNTSSHQCTVLQPPACLQFDYCYMIHTCALLTMIRLSALPGMIDSVMHTRIPSLCPPISCMLQVRSQYETRRQLLELYMCTPLSFSDIVHAPDPTTTLWCTHLHLLLIDDPPSRIPLIQPYLYSVYMCTTLLCSDLLHAPGTIIQSRYINVCSSIVLQLTHGYNLHCSSVLLRPPASSQSGHSSLEHMFVLT